MKLAPVLMVIDMQNGFCAPGGTFDRFGFNIAPYRAVIPSIQAVMTALRARHVPVYYSKAVREPSGLDCLDRVHRIIPEPRRERIEKMPLCIRDTWDSDIIDELAPAPADHIVEKRRDSAFQDTELGLWLQALKADTIIFTGIDTYICVESTVRDAFNRGYDVIVLGDCVASRQPKHHVATIEQIADAFGLVLTADALIERLDKGEFTI